MLRFATAICLLSPSLAAAQCITAESLDAGITVEYGNGNVSHIQRQADGSLLDAYSDTDSYFKATLHFESVDGVILNRWVMHEDGSWAIQEQASQTYDFALDSMAPYAAGNREVGTSTWAENRYESGDKTFSWIGYESEPLVVGACSYEAVRVFTYELSLEDEVFYTREIKYLPELGLGLQLGNSYFNFSPDNAVIVSMSAS